MGNHRFKFSDMIPNVWFYKLKDMSRSRKKNKASSVTPSLRSQQRCSNYFPREMSSISRPGKLYNSPNFSTRGASEIPFIDSPRRSSKRRTRRRTVYYKPSSPTLFSSSVSATSSCHSINNWPHQPNLQTQSPDYYISSVESSSESDLHDDDIVSSESECDSFSAAAAADSAPPDIFNGLPSNCSCRVSSSTNDIIIDMNNEVPFHQVNNSEKLDGFETISELDLPPILTKPPLKFDDDDDDDDDDKFIKATATELRSSSRSQSVNNGFKKESIRTTQRDRRSSHNNNNGRKSSVNSSTGIRLRVNSPKLAASRKVQAASSARRKNNNAGFPEGFAVVKSSFDPQRDFRDSMLEMIMENNIRASKDLEDLLACYLSLNSSEYQELIVKAFEQIWFDMAQLKL